MMNWLTLFHDDDYPHNINLETKNKNSFLLINYHTTLNYNYF